MPLASTLWPISGRSVRVIPAPSLVRSEWSGVVAEDEVGHAAGLGLPLDLVGEPVHGFGSGAPGAVELLDLGDLDVHADAAVDRQRRREAHPAQAVVEDDAEALYRADLPEEAGRQAEGQEAVLDRRAVRPRPGPLPVDMDPLLVAGERRERVDVLLLDGAPGTHPDLLADPLPKAVETFQ